MRLRLTTTLVMLGLSAARLGAQTVVALDGYHNNERAMPEHYQWEGTTAGSFSKLANGFRVRALQLTDLAVRHPVSRGDVSEGQR